MKEIYRSAASILVLRRHEGAHQILLLHKPRKRDAWQLPQGGCEKGESMEQAAVRELKEEAGIGGVRILGTSAKVYQYDFPPSYRRFRPDNVKGQRIVFVLAVLEGDPPVQVDGKEVDQFAWATTQQLHLYIKRKEYVELVRGLYEEARICLSHAGEER
jgi:8-oxo-dGTP pyrophosphatase MutT (NUDIX family)